MIHCNNFVRSSVSFFHYACIRAGIEPLVMRRNLKMTRQCWFARVKRNNKPRKSEFKRLAVALEIDPRTFVKILNEYFK